METTFEKSEIYKKALQEYQEKIYGAILKPLHSIVRNSDVVYLFYNQAIVQDIFLKLKEIYNKENDGEDTYLPIHLGYEEPLLEDIIFMGNKYKVIHLWYDNCDIPKEFTAKI